MISLRDKIVQESVLSSTNTGKSGIVQSIKNIFNEAPTTKNLEELEKLWNILGLGIKNAHWKINFDNYFYYKEKINYLRIDPRKKVVYVYISKQNLKDEKLIKKIEDELSLKLSLKPTLNKEYNTYILESVLSSTKTGLRPKIEEWIKNVGLHNYSINNDDNSIDINEYYFVFKETDIPDYIKINKAKDITFIQCPSSILKNLPKKAYTITLENMEIDDFVWFKSDCKRLFVYESTIKSLKGIPKDCLSLGLGNNTNHFVKKDIVKLVNTKPQNIYTMGYYERLYNSIVLGKYDIMWVKKIELELRELYQKWLPELKYFKIDANLEHSSIYLRLDFLNKEEIPHNIADNSIYINFRYNLDEFSLENNSNGHLELTPEDKAEKYKYYALKSVTAPYIDNGGKKFRKVRLDDFNAKAIFDKTKDWLRDVIDAALKDQGGQLKRR